MSHNQLPGDPSITPEVITTLLADPDHRRGTAIHPEAHLTLLRTDPAYRAAVRASVVATVEAEQREALAAPPRPRGLWAWLAHRAR